MRLRADRQVERREEAHLRCKAWAGLTNQQKTASLIGRERPPFVVGAITLAGGKSKRQMRKLVGVPQVPPKESK